MLLLVQYAYDVVKLFVSSFLLPALLTSLSSQKHSPNTATSILTEYDYIVVGAGSGGSVVASRLSEMPCVNILLLEAGKPPPLLTEVPGLARFFWFTDIDWKFRTAPQRYTGDQLIGRQLVWPSGKTLGGSSVLNGMLYVRGNRQNYDRWAAEGAEGWSYKDVLPYFIKMEDNRDPEYVANGFHGVHGPQTVHRPRYQAEYKDSVFRTIREMGYKVVDPNAYRQTGFYDNQANLRAGQRCSTAKAYLVPAENRTNLDILPNAYVRKILIENRRAVGVQFDYQGNTIEVRARREVIMSAGTTNTAQLLMLSGIGPKEELQKFGIPVIADLPVGRNLQDHAGTFVPFALPLYIQRLSEKVLNPNNVRQYIQNRTGPLASSEFISVLAFLQNNAIVPDKGDDLPDHQLYFAEVQSEISYQTGMSLKYFFQVMAPYLGQPAMICVSHILNPRSRGTVTLQSTNPYDPPVIDPNYFEDPMDVQDVVEGLKACKRIGNHPIMRQFGLTPFTTLIPGCEQYAGNDDLYFTCSVRSMVITFSHQVGTARMGHPNDPRTVVDPQLRVLQIKGLRVVDASVMPIVPSGNTNVPTIMVAEKASDIIKSTIGCYKDPEDQFDEMQKPGWYDKPQYFQQMPESYMQGMRPQFGTKGMGPFKSGEIPQFNSETDMREPLVKLGNDDLKDDLFDSEWSNAEPKIVTWNKDSPKALKGIRPISTKLEPNETLLGNSGSLIDFRGRQVPLKNPRTSQRESFSTSDHNQDKSTRPLKTRDNKRKNVLIETRKNEQNPENGERFRSKKVLKLPLTELEKKKTTGKRVEHNPSKFITNSQQLENQYSQKTSGGNPLKVDLSDVKAIMAATQNTKEGASSISDTVPWNQVIQLSTPSEFAETLKNLTVSKSDDNFSDSDQLRKRSTNMKPLNQEILIANIPNQQTLERNQRNDFSRFGLKSKQYSINKPKVTAWNTELTNEENRKPDSSQKLLISGEQQNTKTLLELSPKTPLLRPKSEPRNGASNSGKNTKTNSGVWKGDVLISVPWNEEIQQGLNITKTSSEDSGKQRTQRSNNLQLKPQNRQSSIKLNNRPWNAELINPMSSAVLNAKRTRLGGGMLANKIRTLMPSKFSNTQQMSRPQLAVKHQNQIVSQAKLKTRPWNAELVSG